MKLFVSPHNDDEVLFGAFTLMTEKPYVVVVYDSYVQADRGIEGCGWEARRYETIKACEVLGIPMEKIFFLGLPDNKPEVPGTIVSRLDWVLERMTEMEPGARIETVYAPADYSPKGNAQHNKVSIACQYKFHTSQLMFYHTYKAHFKVCQGMRVAIPEDRPAVAMKLAALLEYRSQLNLWSTRDHFLRDQYEYVEAPNA